MNCPHCETPIDEHEKGDCFDAWVHAVVFGKPVEWIEDQEEEFPLTNMSDGSEEISTYTIPGHFFDHTDKSVYMHTSDGFTGMIPKYSWWIGHADVVLRHISREWAIGIFHVPSISSVMFGWLVLLDKNVYPPTRDTKDAIYGRADSLGELPLAICRAAIKASLPE